MKQYICKSLLLLAMTASMASCDHFLDEKSQDLYIPKTVQDYSEFLLGEGLNHGTNNQISISEYLDLLTDDVNEYVNVRRKDARDSRETMWGYYTWQNDPEVDYNNTVAADRSWEVYYHRVLISNIILDQLGSAKGTEAEKKELEGEARFLRAWSYFMLANTYAAPFESDEQANRTPAVPINSSSSIENRNLTKSTLGDVYRLIESDLDASIAAFEGSIGERTIYRPNVGAAYLLRSRVALYKKQYQAAADYATKAIEKSGKKLYDLTDGVAQANDRFLNSANTEVLFTYGSDTQFKLQTFITASNSEKGCYLVDPGLISMYTSGDVRLKAFFYAYMRRYKPYKFYAARSHGMYPYAFHLSEAYLNRAEAYAALGQKDAALQDINTIRNSRIADNTPLTAASQDETLQLVKDERRMELCFEGTRWFDLRRWGCPEISHTYSSSDTGGEKVQYTLQKGDSRYTLPIPRAERSINNN